MSGRAAPAVLAALALVAAGCSRGRPEAAPGPAALPTEEVSEKPDAHASLADEQVEVRPAAPAGVAGILPEGFPRDVPLPEPSSLVDFGRGPRGGAQVVLEVQAAPAAARAAYEQRLRRAGFEPDAAGVWRRGARAIGVEVVPFSGAARVELEILPAGR